MIIYALINQKGGVGKTTLAVNLAAGLARRGRRVLAVDLDAGAGLTTSLRVDGPRDVADFITGAGPPVEYAVKVRENLDVILSNRGATAELEHTAVVAGDRERTLLKRRLGRGGYDFAFLDTGPGVNVLNINALRAAGRLVVPILADYLSLKAVAGLMADLMDFRARLGPGAVGTIACIVPMAVDTRRRLTAAVLDTLTNELRVAVAPTVRLNVKFAEAPSYGKTIYEYDRRRGGGDIDNVLNYLLKTEVK